MVFSKQLFAKFKRVMKKNIALTYGDFNGIGAEVLLKSLTVIQGQKLLANLNLQLFGSEDFIHKTCSNLGLSFKELFADVQIIQIDLPKDAQSIGKHSYECLERVTDSAKRGLVHGLVTGPVSKHALVESGHDFKGQTELLSFKLTAAAELLFMASAEQNFRDNKTWRVQLLTRHTPLEQVVKEITFERLQQSTQTLRNFLTNNLGIKTPQIAMASINPHAGEKGEIGSEELDYLNDWARSLNIHGPFSPDELWFKSSRAYLSNSYQPYDAYIAPYHDQVLPLIKSVTNLQAVNVSIGLPIPRTSPDHGTAYDLLGKNQADFKPYLEAILCCCELTKA
jgi:4-hydroxythreonine-4-phosphate dehydrogenase